MSCPWKNSSDWIDGLKTKDKEIINSNPSFKLIVARAFSAGAIYQHSVNQEILNQITEATERIESNTKKLEALLP